MGWKNVKEHYKIEHIVCVENGIINIGSPYVKDLIVIKPTGDVSWGHWDSDDQYLKRYYSELCSDKQKLIDLINSPDVFERSIRVFYFADGEIKTDFCETLGWPNVTHSGKLMYEGTFSTDYDTIVEKVKVDLGNEINYWEGRIIEARKEIAGFQSYMDSCLKYLEALDADAR